MTESSSIVTLPGKPSSIPLMSCLGETIRTSAAKLTPTNSEDLRETEPTHAVVPVKAGRNHNRDSGGALQNLCFCLI